jgi:hypothetical protein
MAIRTLLCVGSVALGVGVTCAALALPVGAAEPAAPEAAATAGVDGLMLSSAARGGSGRPVAVALEQGPDAVSAFRAALKALPRNPIGEPAWRLDVLRAGQLVDSYELSERECELLGASVAPLLRQLRGAPGAYLYRLDLPAARVEQADWVMIRLAGAGFPSFRPGSEQQSWYVYELLVEAREAPRISGPAPVGGGPGAAREEADYAQFERRLRSLLQPRPLDDREDRLFRPLSRDLYIQYRDLYANPAIRELQVDYARQRWLSATGTRNLNVTVRYMVRSERELEEIERYFAAPSRAKGRSLRPQKVVLQLIAKDADAGRVRARLNELLPDLDQLRPGR